jgi:D-alanyl-D-alanine carboxypeptidase
MTAAVLMKPHRRIPIVALAALILTSCVDDGHHGAPPNRPAAAAVTTTAPATSAAAKPHTTPATPTTEPHETTTSTSASTSTRSENSTGTSVVATVDEAVLQALLDRWRTDVNAYGATLSMRVPGHDDIHLASGIDDRDPKTPMPTDGTFHAASITKTFVAAVALQLVDEGRLALDDTVEAWLPELPAAGRTTLAMLLDHTAGLGEWEPDILADLTRTYTGEEVLSHSVEQTPYGRPGERFAYSNANFTAAALLLERELHQGLGEIIDERITGPLSLDDTLIADGSVKPTRHGWFSLDGDPDRPLDTLDFPHEAAVTTLWGAGNLVTSSSDLLTWGQALYSGDLLGNGLTATMLQMRNSFMPGDGTPQFVATDAPTPLHYGLGTMGFCLDLNGCDPAKVEIVGHSGRITGSRSLVAYHRDSGTTIVVHANIDEIELPQLVALLPDVIAALGTT